jgi:hypothetical protein
VATTFAQAKAIVRAAEERTWTQGTYLIEERFQDATHNPDQRPRVPRRHGSLQSAYEGRGAYQIRAAGSCSDLRDGEADHRG